MLIHHFLTVSLFAISMRLFATAPAMASESPGVKIWIYHGDIIGLPCGLPGYQFTTFFTPKISECAKL